ncbi:MAG: hypothetical protein NZV14_05865 [Bryobacteraceae bacterium]|nr:hypothetical protein [Bryobacteraceae bacterium]MDW8377666.1 hypothetical protein [Bryobacterales bacterium]
MKRKLCITIFVVATTLAASDWSQPVEVRQDTALCVTYRARLAGDYLIVEATHEPGWHTNAMDNDKRAAEKLAGRKALGVDKPTQITSNDLEISGPWRQTPPKDFSKPDLLWYTWGFDAKAQFVAKVKSPKAGQVTVRGQACSESSCRNVEVTLDVPQPQSPSAPPNLDGLELVR